MERIVVGYDGSEHGNRALEQAIDLAAGKASLIVVSAAHVSTLTRAPSAVDPIEAESARGNLDKARERLEAKGVEARTVEAHGDPADALVRVADEEGADLIVVGTRGLNAAQGRSSDP